MQLNYKLRQQAHARVRLLKDAERLGNVSKACRLHDTSRKSYYKWKARYDGTVESLMDRPRTPKSHPNQLTDQEHQLIDRVARDKSYTDKHGQRHHPGLHRLHHLLVTHHGFTRSVGGLYKALQRLGYYAPAKARRRRKYKRYERPFPGANVQIDIMYLDPIRGQTEYQYTAIDEFSRLQFARIFDDISQYHTVRFLRDALDFFHKHHLRVLQVQTDHGIEFTHAAYPHIHVEHPFERELREEHITHKLTPIGKPHLQGKVERAHRIAEDEFHCRRFFRTSPERKRAFQAYITYYNHQRPHGSLNWSTPIAHLQAWRDSQSVTYD
jgi:transposase InsO family protein